MTISTYDWSGQQELLDSVSSFVSQDGLFWRDTSTGLKRHDKPIELKTLASMIELAYKTRVQDWWVMKQEPGAPGALPHIHNNWDTYIYYTDWSDAHLCCEDIEIMPKPGLMVYLPAGTMHGVEDSYAEEGGATRYSCVFLTYPKEGWTDDQETQGQET